MVLQPNCSFTGLQEEDLNQLKVEANPMELKKGIEKAVNIVTEELSKQAIVVGDDYDKIKQIATISANNDSVIGELIADFHSKRLELMV